DLVLILSDHSEFKQLTDGDFGGMRNKYILDTKNVVKTKDEFKEVKYYNFGNLYNL
ncbi:UDP-N-acetyl-D-mannosamine dehydrogenase, partial [Eggerthella lenta]|nr:UDP-N-acetyl-D-mannosamine dehydrogenase [Eggerthella lenta]